MQHAQIAQLVEQRTENPCVAGSIPALGTFLLPKLHNENILTAANIYLSAVFSYYI